ncbi:hypothetical protein [Maribacter sp. 2304DJ31-5]|uniref:hypothetical protein n=1 Tax=Maribacter sp. 2304DJ31-5 TaxID=3386273 RepID=UPI0039BC3319
MGIVAKWARLIKLMLIDTPIGKNEDSRAPTKIDEECEYLHLLACKPDFKNK